MRHQVFHHRTERIPGGPNQQSIGKNFHHLAAIWFGVFGFNVFIRYLLDHGLCSDGDGFLLEGGFGVIDQLF